MDKIKGWSDVKIYYPEETRSKSAIVRHISLSRDEALSGGWHFRYKSRKRIRITRYTGSEENVIVPAMIDGCIVNEIGAAAFKKTKIRAVSIPDTVKKLGEECFCWSRELESVLFADGVETIPARAFRDCKSLARIHLPYTLRMVGEEAFMFCERLEFIDLPEFCRSVGRRAFYWTKLKGFAMTGWRLFRSEIDGTAFEQTPLWHEYDMINHAERYGLPTEINIMSAGVDHFENVIRFPKGSRVCFFKHSVFAHCGFDLSECREIILPPDTFFDENKDFRHYKITLIFPEDKMPRSVPVSVKSNFFGNGNYRLEYKDATSQVVSAERVRLLKYSIDSQDLRAIRFREVYTTETDPIQVVHPSCYDLHAVIWEENGCTYRKLTPPCELLRDRHNEVHNFLLKAFTIRRDPDTGRSIFYDRSVVDRLFRGEYYDTFPIRPTRYDKVLIAADMLRSTPKPEEESTDMYRRYLLRNKRRADIVLAHLPERWSEYAQFLKEFYEVNK